MFPSHVMGTFGSNRIYTVGRVVKVEDLMRWRFAPRGFDSLRISMENSSVPKSCTDLDPTLLYILKLGTYSKFELSRLKGLAQIRKRKKYGLVGNNIFVWEKFRIHSGVLRVARGGYAKPLAARPRKINARARHLPLAMAEPWPQVCRVEITFGLLLTICFVSTQTNPMNCLANDRELDF